MRDFATSQSSSASVSYTHLDVYKRQEKQRDVMEQYYNDDLSLSEIAANFGITRQGVRDAIKRGAGTILEPVSYTHLDVYKRQGGPPRARHHHSRHAARL